MNKVIVAFCFVFLFACQDRQTEAPVKNFVILPVNGKLESLFALPQDSVLDSYDLSNDNLLDFPDLSGYTIKSLNLSYNYLDTLIWAYMPKGLEILNLSHNYIRRFPYDYKDKRIRELDISYNFIKFFRHLMYCIDRINISYNDLERFHLNWTYSYYYGYKKGKPERMSYLNISNNPRLSNEIWVVLPLVDTIVRDNIANDKELQMVDYEAGRPKDWYENFMKRLSSGNN